MKSVPLKAFPRTLVQRGAVKKLRASGRVPATIYGGQTKPQNLEVVYDDITELLHHSVSENVLVDLSVENDPRAKRLALVQEIQHHPLSAKVLHVDFHEVAENEKVTIFVPVETIGEAAGVKTGGGSLTHVLLKLKVRALPANLPDALHFDLSQLTTLDASLTVADLVMPEGVTAQSDPTEVVVRVIGRRSDESPTSEAVTVAEFSRGSPNCDEKVLKSERAVG